MITIEESFGVIQMLLVAGLETNRGERWFFVHAERSVGLRPLQFALQ